MKKILKTIRNVILLILFILILIGGYFTYKGYEKYEKAIKEISIKEKVEEIKENKNYTSLDEMPKMYKDAVIATEDRRFYTHKGIDVISISRAIARDITQRKMVEGGSTITQQLAKNSYFTQEASAERKIAEVFMANAYEKECSKDDILELYLNTCYFGDGCYSVKTAAMHYFGKEPMEMEEFECIMLAGIPNAPSVYAPTKNLDLAKQRAMQVLRKLEKYGYIDKEEAEKIQNKIESVK